MMITKMKVMMRKTKRVMTMKKKMMLMTTRMKKVKVRKMTMTKSSKKMIVMKMISNNNIFNNKSYSKDVVLLNCEIN